ncbi:MAG TPA: 2'-5' RNA ligase family protein [Abditibacteriaceae bacterium]|jgi:2'-5' RNA ligase
MLTNYVENIDDWKSWQQEYRYGVFLIFPPDPPLSQVNALRQKYAWSQSSECDAHISLTIPLPQPLTHDHWQELQSIACRIAAFPISYGPLKNYLPHPGVCLAIEPQDKLDALRADLETALCFSRAIPRRFPFSAHMTIAEMITVEQTKVFMLDLADTAPKGTFSCTHVSYAVPDANFSFTERGRLQLANR